tara:strand:+ start:852 stop:1115 length:264 start_codon:yes stop_codon:yes gene_type:complete
VKIVDINSGKSIDDQDLVTSELVEGLSNFIAVAVEANVKGFAAVAVTKDGNCIDSWHCQGIPAPMLLGAIDILKTQFKKEIIRDKKP